MANISRNESWIDQLSFTNGSEYVFRFFKECNGSYQVDIIKLPDETILQSVESSPRGGHMISFNEKDIISSLNDAQAEAKKWARANEFASGRAFKYSLTSKN